MGQAPYRQRCSKLDVDTRLAEVARLTRKIPNAQEIADQPHKSIRERHRRSNANASGPHEPKTHAHTHVSPNMSATHTPHGARQTTHKSCAKQRIGKPVPMKTARDAERMWGADVHTIHVAQILCHDIQDALWTDGARSALPID